MCRLADLPPALSAATLIGGSRRGGRPQIDGAASALPWACRARAVRISREFHICAALSRGQCPATKTTAVGGGAVIGEQCDYREDYVVNIRRLTRPDTERGRDWPGCPGQLWVA